MGKPSQGVCHASQVQKQGHNRHQLKSDSSQSCTRGQQHANKSHPVSMDLIGANFDSHPLLTLIPCSSSAHKHASCSYSSTKHASQELQQLITDAQPASLTCKPDTKCTTTFAVKRALLHRSSIAWVGQRVQKPQATSHYPVGSPRKSTVFAGSIGLWSSLLQVRTVL